MMPAELIIVLVVVAALAGWMLGSYWTERIYDRRFGDLLEAFASLKKSLSNRNGCRDDEDDANWWRRGTAEDS